MVRSESQEGGSFEQKIDECEHHRLNILRILPPIIYLMSYAHTPLLAISTAAVGYILLVESDC